MEAKEAIVKLIKALVEIGDPIQRQMLIDYLTGRASRQIDEAGLSENETFGIGESHEEDYWSTVIDAAYEAEYIKQMTTKMEALVPTSAGKKFAKKPTSFIIPDEEAMGDSDAHVHELDTIFEQEHTERQHSTDATSATAKKQIKLITAIDRHIALEDFAESEGIDLSDVLDSLEMMAAQGYYLDINYFTDEVLGEDCMEELLDYFQNAKTDDMKKALEEYGDAYQEEELRLARIVYRMNKLS